MIFWKPTRGIVEEGDDCFWASMVKEQFWNNIREMKRRLDQVKRHMFQRFVKSYAEISDMWTSGVDEAAAS